MSQLTLSGREIQKLAVGRAFSLAGVTDGYPFTDTLRVFKVSGRVFLVVTEDPSEQIVTIKAEPLRASALIREHESIRQGRYFDKRHWISLGRGSSFTASVIEDLVDDSYDLVVDRLPAHQRDRLRGNGNGRQ